MKKIKILIVIPAFSIGGAERMATYLAVFLNKDLFEITVTSLSKRLNNILEKMLEKENIKTLYVDKNKGFDLNTFFRLKRIIEDFNPDIIHSHQTVMRYLIPFINKKSIFIHTIHNIASKEIPGSIMRKLQNYTYKKGVIPVSISKEVSSSFLKEYGFIPRTEISNGIPLDQHYLSSENKIKFRNCNGLTQKDIVFVNVAGFREAKNHKLLIYAFSKIINKMQNSKLVLVGNGNLLSESKELAKKLKLENSIYFFGLRNDIPEILNASDIFIMSSDYEGYPLSIMEAMASRLPVISTNVGGVPEIVKDNVSGILVPPNDIEKLSSVMAYLYENPEVRKKMGEEGRKIALENFSVEKMCKSYEELYLKLLEEKKAK